MASFTSAAAKSVLRSPPLRIWAARVAAEALAGSHPARRCLPKLRPSATARFARFPVESSFCLESLMPMHSTTASALMTSLLNVSRRGDGWLAEGL